MPAKSGAQYRAMQAALHGSGRLGIPKDVAQEFVSATPSDKRSAWTKSVGALATKRLGKR